MRHPHKIIAQDSSTGMFSKQNEHPEARENLTAIKPYCLNFNESPFGEELQLVPAAHRVVYVPSNGTIPKLVSVQLCR